jgi:hypothetical protein
VSVLIKRQTYKSKSNINKLLAYENGIIYIHQKIILPTLILMKQEHIDIFGEQVGGSFLLLTQDDNRLLLKPYDEC